MAFTICLRAQTVRSSSRPINYIGLGAETVASHAGRLATIK